ncbi:MAG: hypothetical protein CSB19_00905 [Clostridiales bacterium]|nr:MAG: hypothetical protein CSB19_00905 [Clostridiales bacterium]
MLKKLMAVMLIVAMVFSLTACGGQSSGGDTPAETTAAGGTDKASEGAWKIGILTGTVSQNEEEYRAAENVLKKYGDEHVVLKTYPDKFMDEQDTTISNIVELASDPDIKALIIVQAVPGVSAGIEKARELRDDLLVIAGVPGEDPAMISSKADIVLNVDELTMGTTIPEQAKAMGAKVFVHYSFPRHMSYALLSARRDLMKQTCENIGLEFVDATAPDPTGDAGVPGAQQFILEDVPRMVAKYGKDTAFFSTNCSMQVPLIESSVAQGAIYPQPCCPSPTHGYPSALALDIPDDKKADMNFILEETKRVLAEKGVAGRFSTWAVPVSMMYVQGGAEYAKKWILGEITEKFDADALKAEFEAYAGTEVQMQSLVDNGKEYPNYLMFLLDFYTF